MANVDLPIALSIFVVFLVITVVLAMNYFLSIPNFFKTRELREKAENLFDNIFKTKGYPESWEESGGIPATPGVMVYLKKIPLLIEETGGINRVNEPVTINITFDEHCSNSTWNNTVRIYDENLMPVPFNLSDQNFCSSQFLKSANVNFNVNISAKEKKKYDIYYSDDKTVLASNDTILFNTESWIPNNGDSWTESTGSWSIYTSSGSITADSSNKKIGDNSVSITGQLDSNGLGMVYNPSSSISGVSNGWFISVWVFVDNTAGLNGFNISISDGNDIITTNILNEIESSAWHLFEKNLSQSLWSNWTSFNAANGIDFVRFHVYGNEGLSRTIKVDGLKFELAPLTVNVFPEESIKAISPSKIKGLKNATSSEVGVIGEGYKFTIEIEEK